MSWRATLALRYSLRGGRTVAQDRHEGPLRVLRALHPEGDAVCHHVLVHPPGGLVGGDELALRVEVEPGAHALITTPSATRYYRSEGPAAGQDARLRVGTGARLEWLPLENIAYPGCNAFSRTNVQLCDGAQMLGWDLLALGLPASGAPFSRGRFLQHLECVGTWLERGSIDAADRQLLESPLGFAGHSVLATAWFATGTGLDEGLRQDLLDGAREALLQATAPDAHSASTESPDRVSSAQSNLASTAAGLTSPQPSVVVARLLAHRVEPALRGLMAVRAAWRQVAWGLPPNPPRIWRT